MGQLRRKFAKRLKELRQKNGMTQDELAQITGLSTSFIRSLEQSVFAPSFESLEKLSQGLNVEVKDFFDF